MRTKRPTPLTGDELRNLRDRFGSDRLARLLLWEIARLRSVVMVLYRQICRLSYHRPDEVGPGLDQETEAVLDVEPVILENARPRLAKTTSPAVNIVGRTCLQKRKRY